MAQRAGFIFFYTMTDSSAEFFRFVEMSKLIAAKMRETKCYYFLNTIICVAFGRRQRGSIARWYTTTTRDACERLLTIVESPIPRSWSDLEYFI